MTASTPITTSVMTKGRLPDDPEPETLAELNLILLGEPDASDCPAETVDRQMMYQRHSTPDRADRETVQGEKSKILRKKGLVGAWYLADSLPAHAQEVLDHVLAQAVRHRSEHAPAVAARYFVDERGEPLVVGEHEHVQCRPAPRHLVDFGQGEFKRLRRWRPVEPEPAVPAQVGGRLAIGDDHYDRIVLGTSVQEAAGQHQGMVKIGALDHIPVEAGQLCLA